MVSLLDYLKLAEEHKGTADYLGFGAVAEIICRRYGIRVDHDFYEIVVHADHDIIAKIEF